MPNKFEYVKKGYNPFAVDRYINDLEMIITNYKEKDSAITNAILNAQIAADEITRKANLAAETIIRNARNMSGHISETTTKQIDSILKGIMTQKEQLRSLQVDYESLVKKYLDNIDGSDFNEAENKLTILETYLNELKKVDIDIEIEVGQPEEES